MGILYIVIAILFLILFIVNFTWIVVNVVSWTTTGFEALLKAGNFIDKIYYSKYLKWILLFDGLWLTVMLAWVLKRKHYKTDPIFHYLKYKQIVNPSICVVIPAYNEELAIESVVKDFVKQKNVRHVIVVDNHSLL